jgi:hypothetical protein
MNALPHFVPMDGNVAGTFESQPHSVPANLKDGDFEHLLKSACGISNDDRFAMLSG